MFVGVEAAIRLGRFDDADKLLADARRINPDDLFVLIESARMAERRGDWEEAIEG